jgi:hypothetical protein
MLAITRETAQRHKPEYHNRHLHRCDNLKSQICINKNTYYIQMRYFLKVRKNINYKNWKTKAQKDEPRNLGYNKENHVIFTGNLLLLGSSSSALQSFVSLGFP